MSSVKLRLVAGGGSADRKSGEHAPRQQYRVGNVFYPFGVPADLKSRKLKYGDDPTEWLRAGWVAFVEKIAPIARLRRNPEEWGLSLEPTSYQGRSATDPPPRRNLEGNQP